MRVRRAPRGWRSGLERKFADACRGAGVRFLYEEMKLSYTMPLKERTYTPDFQVFKSDGTVLIIETKGYWDSADRLKMVQVLHDHPDKDIRIVFQRSHTKIRKGSKTTYAMYAEKIGLRWATLATWERWLDE